MTEPEQVKDFYIANSSPTHESELANSAVAGKPAHPEKNIGGSCKQYCKIRNNVGKVHSSVAA